MHVNVNKSFVLISAFILLATSIYTAIPTATPSAPESSEVAAPAPVQVSTQLISPSTYQLTVRGYGEVSSPQQLALRAEVSGRITAMNPQFKTGNLVTAKEQLLKVDDTALKAKITSAQVAIKEIQLSLAEEALELSVTSRYPSNPAGKSTQNPLRAPKKSLLETQLTHAKAELNAANYQLASTSITAPFNALIVAKSVSVGSYLQLGSEVATLYGTSQAEIEILLSELQWQLLPSLAPLPWHAKLTSVTGDTSWSAKVTRVAHHIEQETQKRAVYIAIDTPLEQTPQLSFGSFVSAEIAGQTLFDVWQIPTSAVTSDGLIWFVQENTLRAHQPQLITQHEGMSYLQPFTTNATLQLVTKPLSHYREGMVVTVINSGTDNV
ncbi:efflux RND transporter periplasmic adaptor subunit [Pseudoalteromonas sp. J010]|uniref:efflux RND transporter periplasmic adaptor subunit n=1 Tax=Pseudoalteromonas sp. J010 TaxID=998465 RepID=UPI000F6451E9|nr:efflux RND transporter periplasmic adaptor subunit [Pseudoalteromonas sp. J010]RRS08046.1 efflux RND transporter periplasmic adaptor subunit [Pseudoalteromonas sp. J010]